MKFRFVALITALIASQTAFAGTVTSSSNLEFLALDGQKSSKSLLKQSHSFNINDTKQHQVVVRVSEIVRDGSDQSLFESDPIVVTFQGSTEDIQISAPRLNSQRDVDNFNKNPVITVRTTSGNTIASKHDFLKGEGFLPHLNIEENLANYNSSNAPAAVAGFATTSMPTAMPIANNNSGKVSKGKITVQGENVAEQMLQYWYQQADSETKARFLDWAKKN